MTSPNLISDILSNSSDHGSVCLTDELTSFCLQTVNTPLMTKLELPGHNQLFAKRPVNVRHPCLESHGWYAESLQRMILVTAGVESSCITKFSCPKLTYLNMRASSPTSEEVTGVRLPCLEAFPLLEKLRLDNFALMDQGCLWKPFAALKRSATHATYPS